MRSLSSLALIAVLLPALSVSCAFAAPYGAQPRYRQAALFYPKCAKPLHDLQRSRSQQGNAAQGAAVGAGFGLLTGLLCVLAADEKKHCIAPTIAATAAGGAIGALYQSKQGTTDDTRRMAEYLEELEGDIEGLDMVTAAARVSLQCYDLQADGLLHYDLPRRLVSREEARARFAEIQRGRAEAMRVLGIAEERGSRIEREYQMALNKEEENLRRPHPARMTGEEAYPDQPGAVSTVSTHPPQRGTKARTPQHQTRVSKHTSSTPHSTVSTTSRTHPSVKNTSRSTAKNTSRSHSTVKNTSRYSTASTDSAKRRSVKKKQQEAQAKLAQAQQKRGELQKKVVKVSEEKKAAQRKSEADQKEVERILKEADV